MANKYTLRRLNRTPAEAEERTRLFNEERAERKRREKEMELKDYRELLDGHIGRVEELKDRVKEQLDYDYISELIAEELDNEVTIDLDDIISQVSEELARDVAKQAVEKLLDLIDVEEYITRKVEEVEFDDREIDEIIQELVF